MTGNLGFNTFIVSDATAIFNRKSTDGQNYSAELMHETTLESLNDKIAIVVTTEFKKHLKTATEKQ
jgi:hypothetical protein